MKGYSKKLSDVYVIPLPFITKPLPPLFVHNPVSVAVFLWHVFFTPNPVQKVHQGDLVVAGGTTSSDAALGVRVTDPNSAMDLWQQGFFGKGTLSRSEPSWFGRTARRLGLDGGELTLEEVTEQRRAKRRQFKREREIQQRLELIEKLRLEQRQHQKQNQNQNESNNSDATVAAAQDDRLQTELKELEREQRELQQPPEEPLVRKEDLELVRGDTIERLEFLQLTPYEAVFLSLGLGVLDVGGAESTSDLLARLFPTAKAWREYVVYHYFRSLGWCMRDGVKFGADFLVYRKGPPFQHAEFAVMVLDPSAAPPWWWLHANMRVLGGAKKTLTLVYVERRGSTTTTTTAEAPNWDKVTSVNAFRRLLASYTVKPITFQRFAPSKNRD